MLSNSYSKNPKSGDIFLVRFHPATGAELKRYRPAVVISNSKFLEKKGLTIVCPLSSALDTNNTLELIIEHQSLQQKSAVLCWYIRTIDQNRLSEKLGTLDFNHMKKIKNVLKKSLALS